MGAAWDTEPVRAMIGADDLDWFKDPQPDLLAAVSGLVPEPSGLHVLLEPLGVVTTQRLAISAYGGRLVAAVWPGELKEQARVLYGGRHGTKVVAAALERGWSAEGSPHLAFRNAAPGQRLYLRPSVSALEYARRWQDGDLAEVGAHERGDVKRRLWPWLKERGYADEDDDPILEEWLDRNLKNRTALLRPGLRLKGHYDVGVERSVVRADVNSILSAAGEPALG